MDCNLGPTRCVVIQECDKGISRTLGCHSNGLACHGLFSTLYGMVLLTNHNPPTQRLEIVCGVHCTKNLPPCLCAHCIGCALDIPKQLASVTMPSGQWRPS